MDDFNLQLKAVEKALLVATNDNERNSLQDLRASLLELLELTNQTENIDIHNSDANGKDRVEEEIINFMKEITELGQLEENLSSIGTEEEKVKSELLELKLELESMIGEKCSAPHKHTWDAVTYHNAIVCGVGDEADLMKDGTTSVYLRVLFTNPTHREMLPCLYYLEGECKFESNNCHYSHGELIPYSDLREYVEPDFEKLVSNCIVLAKMHDRLWHRGRVLCSNFVERECRVRLDENIYKEKEFDFPFEDLFPLYHDNETASAGISDEDTITECENACENDIKKLDQITSNLFTYVPQTSIGDWEKHTRGIGSKLMAKMGYVMGTGLGLRSHGIITPISVQVLPQGCSLDHCMNLREVADGNKDTFNVEEKSKRRKKNQKKFKVNVNEREINCSDVFSFLNTNILNSTGSGFFNPSVGTMQSLQNQPTKSLNVESVRITDNIRKKERDIVKVEESLRRHSAGTEIHVRLSSELRSKQSELKTLRETEKSLTKEQAKRKTRDKLTIF